VISELEQRTMGKVGRRLVPFLLLCYFVACLERVNMSMAKLTMDAQLGLTDAQFGLGAGGAPSKPPHLRQSKNPTTNPAIQSKRRIEPIHKFPEMFIQPQGETSWPGRNLASSRSLSAWKSTPTPAPTCNLRGVAAAS